MSRPRFVGWLLVLVTLLAYLPILRDGFLNFDDRDYVTENQFVRQGLTWPGVQWAFQTWHASNWHPVTWLSHMADCEIFRLNPSGHHLVSLLFHAANVWLLFRLWRRLTNALWASAMVAALFAWHPLHIESVAWVAERKDVLSTFFALLALLAYTEYAKKRDAETTHKGGERRAESGAAKGEHPTSNIQHPTSSGEQGPTSVLRPIFPLPSSLFYLLSLSCFALGLMSKPMLVTLPFVMGLLDFWPLRRFTIYDLRFTIFNPRSTLPVLPAVDRTPSSDLRPPLLWRLVFEKWPFFLLTLASCVVTVLAQRTEAIAPLTKFSLGLRLENVVTAYAGYLYKTIWPEHLAVFYPLLPPAWPAVALAAAILLAISALVWWQAKSQPWLAVGWLWYLGTLVPVIGLLQVGDQALADRYTYFPLIGIFFAGTWAVKDLAQRIRLSRRWLAAAAVLTLAACLAATEHQLRYWRDSETLFAHALAVTADNATARLNLGGALQEANRPDEALVQYRQALKLDPASPEVYNNLGRLLNDAGKPSEALDYCRRAVALNEKSAPSHNGLGVVLAELGRYDEALDQFSAAARLNASYAAPRFQTGRVLLKVGREAEALPQFREALRLEPGNFGMLIFIARVLASDQNPRARDGAEALALAQRAAQLAGGPQPVVLDTLAMACAETGHFDVATNLAQQAIATALARGNQADAAAMRERLELYQKQQPARISYRSQKSPN